MTLIGNEFTALLLSSCGVDEEWELRKPYLILTPRRLGKRQKISLSHNNHHITKQRALDEVHPSTRTDSASSHPSAFLRTQESANGISKNLRTLWSYVYLPYNWRNIRHFSHSRSCWCSFDDRLKVCEASGSHSVHISVAMGPGLTQFTVMPYFRPNSVAHTLQIPSRAALVPAYTVCCGIPIRADTELTTIRPPRAIWGKASWVRKMGAFKMLAVDQECPKSISSFRLMSV